MAVACLLVGGAASWAAVVCVPAVAATRPAFKVVRFHGFRLTVPRGWPVYDLARSPAVCARFNRHAVYLGAPGAQERCPAAAIGRTEAVLIQVAPGRAEAARTRSGQPVPIPALIGSGGSFSGWLVDRRAGVLITASWFHRPDLITRMLHVSSVRALMHPAGVLPPGVPTAGPVGTPARSARRRAAAGPGAVFTGLGFDACSTPSVSAMSRWRSSYRAVGVYIGGISEASCAGLGLSASWVSHESAAGWHLIPIYVGRQAPANDCGCPGISSRSAASQGRFAANDAVKRARGLGLGQGNPLYYDMEGYPRSSANGTAVLKFLRAWTIRLHRLGYLSGVYSSGDSGVVDLVSRAHTRYVEPDELWIARWNAADNTIDPNVPSVDWPLHERLHQDDGAHNETHGGVTINIDGDYVDAATAAAGTAPGVSAPPAASVPPAVSGTPVEGHTLALWHASWSGVPTSYTEQWEDCGTAGAHCTPISGATGQTYGLKASDVGHTIRVVETAGNAFGMGTPVVSVATAQIVSAVPLYWIRNAFGNIYPSPGTPFYGSPRAAGFRGSTITGAAATPSAAGYWVVDAAGRVFPFGNAAAEPPIHHRRIAGIVAAPGGGYWLYTHTGRVYASAGTKFYGSPAAGGFHGQSITGMASTPDGRGYWLVERGGEVFHFGDAAPLPPVAQAHRIAGLMASPDGGYWLYTHTGRVYASAGTKWYGSPRSSGYRGRAITGAAASADGLGYWVVDSAGTVYAFGDAAPVSPAAHSSQRITGIFR